MVYSSKRRVKKKQFKRRKVFVPGYGGMVGRGLGFVQKNLTTKGSTANWMLKKVRQLADAVNIEYKETTGAVTLSPDYNGTMVSFCNLITQGIANGQRIGDSLKMQNMTLRGYGINPTVPEKIRVILFNDKQNTVTNGAALLQFSGTAYSPVSPKKEDSKYLSNILFDQVLDLCPSSSNAIVDFSCVIPINLHTHYVAGSTTVSDNQLRLLIISNTSAACTSIISYTYELSYTDD